MSVIVIDLDAATVDEYHRMGGRPPEPDYFDGDHYAEPDDPDQEPPACAIDGRTPSSRPASSCGGSQPESPAP